MSYRIEFLDLCCDGCYIRLWVVILVVYVLTHVTLRLIKSQNFWNSVKIIVIFCWDYKSVPNRFE